MSGMAVHCNHCGKLVGYTGESVVDIVDMMTRDGWLLCDVGRYYAAGYCKDCQEASDDAES